MGNSLIWVKAEKEFKLKTPTGARIVRAGEELQVNPQKAGRAIEIGLIKPVKNPFENMKAELWPIIGHCSWSALTDEEKAQWEGAVVSQGEAEQAGDVSRWKAAAETLLKIAEVVKGRVGSPKPKAAVYPAGPLAQARSEVDAFFAGSILPRLSALSRVGRLPDLAECPHWRAVEEKWRSLAEGSKSPAAVETIKKAMSGAVEAYEAGRLF